VLYQSAKKEGDGGEGERRHLPFDACIETGADIRSITSAI